MMKKQNPLSEEPWEYFDDCPICQGMKQGRGQTMEDLNKLFKEAENKNHKANRKK